MKGNLFLQFEFVIVYGNLVWKEKWTGVLLPSNFVIDYNLRSNYCVPSFFSSGIVACALLQLEIVPRKLKFYINWRQESFKTTCVCLISSDFV